MGNVGNAIKDIRLREGITVDELATKLGKSRATIYRYESSDIDNMPVSILAPLASALGTTPGEIMNWSPASSVTSKTTITFGDTGPIHDLYQYYIRRPKAVQEEIVSRLKRLDNTFSQNVKYFLTKGASVDELIHSSGINITTFLSLLKDHPSSPSPEEAEKIAAYFRQNVCDMFFEDLAKKPANAVPANKMFNTIRDDLDIKMPSIKLPPEYGTYACKLLKILESRSKNFDLSIASNEIKDMLALPKFESVIKKAITEFYEQPDLDDDALFHNLAILIEKDHDHISRLIKKDELNAASDYINEQLKDRDRFII